MASPEEVFGSRRSPEEVFGATRVGGEPVKKPLTGSFFEEMEIVRSRQEPGIDYKSGISDLGFRAKLSRQDTEQERINVITEKFGEGNVSTDRFNNYVISTEGLKQAGIEADEPRAIDEKGLSFGDIADLSGDAPAIAAGTAAGIATSGMAAIPAIALTGAATAVGKAVGEAGEQIAGENIQPAGEVAMGVAKEGALGATGEGIFRTVLGPLGRKVMAPEAKRMTPEVRVLAEEAREQGMKPTIMQISKPPIIGRTLSIADRIFGDPNAVQNSRALGAWVDRIRAGSGPKAESLVKLGEDVKSTIKGARKALSDWSSDAYTKVDEIAGNEPIVPTQRLKSDAKEYLDDFPRTKAKSTGAQESEDFLASFIGDTPRDVGEAATKKGRVVFMPPEAVKELQDIMQLPDKITTSQMQAIRTRLFDAVDDNTLIPGFDSTIARRLGKSAGKAFKEAADEEGLRPDVSDALSLVDRKYAQEIDKFKSAFIQRLVKDKKYAGEVQPELIMDAIFKKGRSTNIKRIMQFLPKEKQAQVRRAAMDEVLDNIKIAKGDGSIFKGTNLEGLGMADPSDPLVKVFNGKALSRALDGYGKSVLTEMFGKRKTQELYKLARVTEFMTAKQGEFGGLVAAGIATKPLQNIGRLAKLNLVSKLFNTETGIKYLTDGFSVPKFRQGSASVSRFFTELNMLANENTTSDEHKNVQALEIN